MLLVKKYGGSSVSSPEKILAIAKRLKGFHEQGYKLIVIVSAMGDTTDDLVQLSRKITLTPVQREMDMLLSSGERISMALMAIALNSLGCDAISFTGSQSGVFTDGRHNNARITDIKPIRVKQALEENKIVIIAGFQGVDPQTKEVTTLGRGGSDTTAVALAAHFRAHQCDILTDVRGLFSIDPRVPGVAPVLLPRLDYEATLEMAYWGARVLHYRSVELAERNRIPLSVNLSSEEDSGTLVQPMENVEFRAVNFNDQVVAVNFPTTAPLCDVLQNLKECLKQSHVPSPTVICEKTNAQGRTLFLNLPLENVEGLQKALGPAVSVESHWGTVTVSGRGFVNSTSLFEMSALMKEKNIEVATLVTTPLSLSFIIHRNQIQPAVQALHQKFIG